MLGSSIDLESVPADVKSICERLRGAGKRSWIVGGCVRDMLLGRTVSDWDVCTDARPDALMRIFPRAIPTGIEHGTVTVVIAKKHYEVTTLRGEGAYTDGRRPDGVQFIDDITADLARRDFTVNAIAVDPLDGHVIDPFGGRDDLVARVLRAVGNAHERFSEDGLRVLRAARFVATLEMELDPATRAAILPTIGTYRKVSAERVRDEWVKTMKAARPSRAFEVMRENGILEVSCPELLECVGVEQNRYHAFDVWRHTMQCMDACRGDAIVRIAALFHDIGKPRTRAFSDKTNDYTFYEHERVGGTMADPICQRLRFSNEERAKIVALVHHHVIPYSCEWSDAAVRRWIRRVSLERMDDLFLLNEADNCAKGRPEGPDLAPLHALKEHVARVLAAGAALSTRDLKVNGRDLMKELGVPQGRRLGEILEQLLEAVMTDPELNERDRLLEKARELRHSPPA